MKANSSFFTKRVFYLVNKRDKSYLSFNIATKNFQCVKELNPKRYIQKFKLHRYNGSDNLNKEGYYELIGVGRNSYFISPFCENDLYKNTILNVNVSVEEECSEYKLELMPFEKGFIDMTNRFIFISSKKVNNRGDFVKGDFLIFVQAWEGLLKLDYSPKSKRKDNLLARLIKDDKNGIKILQNDNTNIWNFEYSIEKDAKKNTSSLSIFSKDGIVWIPSDCIFEILKFVYSPITMLLVRQVSQQFFYESKKSILWLRFIKLSISHSEDITCFEDTCKFLFGTKFSLCDNENIDFFNLYWRKYFPIEHRKFLKTNKIMCKNYKNFFHPLRNVKVNMPLKVNLGLTMRGNPKMINKNMKCIGCLKQFENTKIREIDVLSWSYDEFEYGGSVVHFGYCSESCFCNHIVKLPSSRFETFDKKIVFDRVFEVVKKYYPKKPYIKVVEEDAKMNERIFFRDLQVGGVSYISISFGGPKLLGFYTFKEIDEKVVKSFLQKNLNLDENINIGAVYVRCRARMGGLYTDKLIYFLFRKVSNLK